MSTRKMLFVFLLLMSTWIDTIYSQRRNTFTQNWLKEDSEKLADALAPINRLLRGLNDNTDVRLIEESLAGLTRKTVSMSCVQALNDTFHSNDMMRKLRYLDATGKLPSGLFVGNTKMTGNYFACSLIKDAHFCTIPALTLALNKSFAFNLSPQICLPNSCSESDVDDMVNQLISYASKFKIPLLNPKNPAIPKSVYCVPNEKKYNAGAICMITVSSLLLLLCLLGTCFEYFYEEVSPDFAPFKPLVEVVQNGEGGLPAEENNDKTNEAFLSLRSVQKEQYLSATRGGRCLEFLLCFSVLRNGSALLDTTVPAGAITCINGLRFFSMTWVILGHSLVFMLMTSTNNPLWAFTVELKRFSFQALTNAVLSVDSFFFLSGLLVSYLSMRRYDKAGKLPLVRYYLHRYIRLTPSLAMAMFFSTYAFPLFGSSSMWDMSLGPESAFTQNCEKYWWTNLLYINNFYPENQSDACFGVVWYLANDMQFYVISPIILFLMYKYKNLGTYLSNGVLIIISIIVTGILIGQGGLSATFADLRDPLKSFAGGKKVEYMTRVYVKPYTRITPYLVGLVVGYQLHRNKDATYTPIVKGQSWLGWILATTVALCLVYGPYSQKTHEWTVAENIIYGSLFRFLWACSLGWLVYACHRGRGGLVNRFLSWKAFIPLSRLSYGAYLVHLSVLMYLYMQHEGKFNISYETQIVYFCATTVIAYMSSFVLAVTVEYPVFNLEKLFLKF